MKTIQSLLVLSTLVSAGNTSFAASPEAMIAAIRAVGMNNISSVTTLRAARCPQCYDFQFIGVTPVGQASAKVRTEGVWNGSTFKIKSTVYDRSK